MRSVVEDALDEAMDHDNHEADLIEKAIHDQVAEFVYKRLRRRPMVVPVVVEV
jgi:ribonuclease J